MPGFFKRFQTARLRIQRERRIWSLNRQVSVNSQPKEGERPVVMFNASSRLGGFSLNAAFTTLTAWSLQLSGVPVIHFACQAGMRRCVLGTNPDDPSQAPPCKACIAQTKKIAGAAQPYWFDFQPDKNLARTIEELNLEQLYSFAYALRLETRAEPVNLPLGELVTPSLRWVLRRHHLLDDEPTLYLMRAFIQSAYRIAQRFAKLLVEANPQAVVVFNGLQFPEGTVRWLARQFGVKVISHEVGFQPFSAVFSTGHVTAYPFNIPDSFALSAGQNARIDAQLSRRFQGDFTMAGITFWPEMQGLSDEFLEFAAGFEQIVPIFTNVIFDTSQAHANTVFPHMFAWLDLLLEIIEEHPETLFVIRAHPDEMREGKASRESVQDWVGEHGLDQLKNVLFVPSTGALSSYDLMNRSKFVVVYNSSIGLEAALLGNPVICGGKARYTQYPTVFLPETPEAYRRQVEHFLAADVLEVPPEFRRNARRVLYHQFYRASLTLGDFIEAHPTPGYVQLKHFTWQDLKPEESITLGVITGGILNDGSFLMPEVRDE